MHIGLCEVSYMYRSVSSGARTQRQIDTWNRKTGHVCHRTKRNEAQCYSRHSNSRRVRKKKLYWSGEVCVCGEGGWGWQLGWMIVAPPNHKRMNPISTTRSSKRESWKREGTDAAHSGTDVNLSKVIFRPIKRLNWSKVGFLRGPQTFIRCCQERIQQSPLQYSAFFALKR